MSEKALRAVAKTAIKQAVKIHFGNVDTPVLIKKSMWNYFNAQNRLYENQFNCQVSKKTELIYNFMQYLYGDLEYVDPTYSDNLMAFDPQFDKMDDWF